MSTSSEQQRQTLEYFHISAADWRSKADSIDPSRKFNVIAARNAYVEDVARRMPGIRSALDVGCGTGELSCALAQAGLHSVGIDFAPDMIRLCEEKAKEIGAAAEFLCASFFDYTPPQPFDLIAANGFIEYISPEEFARFLERTKTMLAPGGSLVFGSRNRLFNIASNNAFTRMELDMGTALALVEESALCGEAKDSASLIASLMTHVGPTQRPEAHPKTTGIEVVTRHQFTPGELVRMVHEHGYETLELYPVHIHAGSSLFKEKALPMHIAVADALQTVAGQHAELLPFASTFMLRARVRSL